MRSLTRARVRIRYYFHALRTINATLLLKPTQSGTRLRVFEYGPVTMHNGGWKIEDRRNLEKRRDYSRVLQSGARIMSNISFRIKFSLLDEFTYCINFKLIIVVIEIKRN